MDWVSFGLLLKANEVLYCIIFAASAIFYALLFRRMFISILDPFFFALIFSVFGFSVVWFLYFTKSIDARYLVSYLLTQIAFWAGLFTFKSLRRREILSKVKVVRIEDEELLEKIFFVTVSSIYIMIQLASYGLIGIPLLLSSHIDIYNNSGGLGILGRALDVLKPCAIFMLVWFLFKRSGSISFKTYQYFFLLMLLLFFALSGSKGEFMLLGFIVFCFLILNASRFKQVFRKLRRLEILIIGAGLCFVFFTIFAQSTENGITSNNLQFFAFRLVSSGDAYFFAYPNHNIEHISGSQPFLALFGDIFSTVRLIPREQQPQILGLQLFQMFSKLDIITGPNARQNVFGYVYFGFFGSIVFSYLIGFLLSLVRNRLYFNLRRNIFTQLFFVLLYINLAGIETDPPQAISEVENVMLILPVIIFITGFFYLMLKKSSSEYNLLTEGKIS
ncbi:MAG TPA: hypothetical protein VG367_10705 [Mucilaginibacter sp.]|jgi:hypothetical protein|nr:hypothetical protein [Mucilaginibacter sp.]